MNNITETVINTPLEDMDNKAITLDNGDAYGFENWMGVQNKGRHFGNLVYRTKSGRIMFIGGYSRNKGYANKENALKAAKANFEKEYKEFINL